MVLRVRVRRLDCLLWQRPIDTPLDRSGDGEVLARFDQLIAEGIQ